MTAPPQDDEPGRSILDQASGQPQRHIQMFDNTFMGGVLMDAADIDGEAYSDNEMRLEFIADLLH